MAVRRIREENGVFVAKQLRAKSGIVWMEVTTSARFVICLAK